MQDFTAIYGGRLDSLSGRIEFWAARVADSNDSRDRRNLKDNTKDLDRRVATLRNAGYTVEQNNGRWSVTR